MGLYDALQRQLKEPTTPLTLDMEFGTYAQAASVEEVPFDHLTAEQRAAALNFEDLRGDYSDSNACKLSEDERNGVLMCATAAARRPDFAARGLLTWCFLALAVLQLAH